MLNYIILNLHETKAILTENDIKKGVEIICNNSLYSPNVNTLTDYFTSHHLPNNLIHIFHIAIVDAKITGFIIGKLLFDTCDLEYIAVAEKHNGLGIASSLIKQLEQTVTSNGGQNIMLEVGANNTKAISLYLKHGFKQISIRKKYYFNSEDAIIMNKNILYNK